MTENQPLEAWRKVWRAAATHISTPALEALAQALEKDDIRLIQGATTTPPPLMCVQDWKVEAACLLGYCGVVEEGGFGTALVGEVEERFAKVCFATNQDLGEAGAIRWLLNTYDGWPRSEMITNLLPEVRRTLANRRIGELSNGAIDVDVAPITGVDR